jgi:hypothetical protein
MALAEVGRYGRNEAHIVIGRLASAGIPAVAFDGNASIADGSHFLIPVRVLVDEDDLTEAQAMLAEPLPDWPEPPA